MLSSFADTEKWFQDTRGKITVDFGDLTKYAPTRLGGEKFQEFELLTKHTGIPVFVLKTKYIYYKNSSGDVVGRTIIDCTEIGNVEKSGIIAPCAIIVSKKFMSLPRKDRVALAYYYIRSASEWDASRSRSDKARDLCKDMDDSNSFVAGSARYFDRMLQMAKEVGYTPFRRGLLRLNTIELKSIEKYGKKNTKKAMAGFVDFKQPFSFVGNLFTPTPETEA
jgi:hypothetical protein